MLFQISNTIPLKHKCTPTEASMASPASAPHVLLVLLAVALAGAAGAGAATFYVTNLCYDTVWPAAIPAADGCGGVRLDPGQTWRLKVPAGTAGGRIWARTECHFAGDRGICGTGDCAGAMCCELSGKPPATLAEFTIGHGGGAGATADYYDVSVVDGFNVPMEFRCLAGGEAPILCGDAGGRPGEARVRTCKGDSDYEIVFCPLPQY
ncbi:hypothetical protein ACP4OV_022755 [Aristida adscensionis]